MEVSVGVPLDGKGELDEYHGHFSGSDGPSDRVALLASIDYMVNVGGVDDGTVE